MSSSRITTAQHFQAACFYGALLPDILATTACRSSGAWLFSKKYGYLQPNFTALVVREYLAVHTFLLFNDNQATNFLVFVSRFGQ